MKQYREDQDKKKRYGGIASGEGGQPRSSAAAVSAALPQLTTPPSRSTYPRPYSLPLRSSPSPLKHLSGPLSRARSAVRTARFEEAA